MTEKPKMRKKCDLPPKEKTLRELVHAANGYTLLAVNLQKEILERLECESPEKDSDSVYLRLAARPLPNRL